MKEKLIKNSLSRLAAFLRCAAILSVIGFFWYCEYHALLPGLYEMSWTTEFAWLSGLAFLQLFSHRSFDCIDFVEKLKIVLELALLSCLCFHWMTRPEMAKTPLALMALLLSIVTTAMLVTDTFLVLYRVQCKYLILTATALSAFAVVLAVYSGLYELAMICIVLSIAAAGDFFLKGGNKNV